MGDGNGRILSASITKFVFSCPVQVFETDTFEFGGLVQAPLGTTRRIFGVIAEIGYAADGLGEQVAQNRVIPNYLLADLRLNRLATIAISVLTVGFEDDAGLHQELPPRPPVLLETISPCSSEKIAAFTKRLGYLEFLMRATEFPRNELLVAHLRLAQNAHQAGNPAWLQEAMNAISLRLRTDPDSQIWLKSTIFNGR